MICVQTRGLSFTGTIMVEHVQSRLRHIMESPQTPDPADSENFQKLRTAYDACLDESTIRERGIKPLDDMLVGLEKIYIPHENRHRGLGRFFSLCKCIVLYLELI